MQMTSLETSYYISEFREDAVEPVRVDGSDGDKNVLLPPWKWRAVAAVAVLFLFAQ